ncbi:hypothetical protein M9H77_34402 [Catharanthus roseus]|uniref:Uncharacterized protein n=1 Tax=Catharanthus roseus TaxID=4058 RepID=A0ACB9ZL35_CATRO|nr:hypothetical protein M9H77_34402 [Catharanthus roseus]
MINPSTNVEVALALRVLEGCSLLHQETTVLAHKHKVIPAFSRIIITLFYLQDKDVMGSSAKFPASLTNLTHYKVCRWRWISDLQGGSDSSSKGNKELKLASLFILEKILVIERLILCIPWPSALKAILKLSLVLIHWHFRNQCCV